MKALLILCLFVAVASPQDKARCHSSCASCRVRCKQKSSNPAACIEMCLEMKRQCCANCGGGPGPRTTCSCT